MKTAVLLASVLALVMAGSCSSKVKKIPESGAKEYVSQIKKYDDTLIDKVHIDKKIPVAAARESLAADSEVSLSKVKAEGAELLPKVGLKSDVNNETRKVSDAAMADTIAMAIKDIEAYIWKKYGLMDTVYFSDFIILKDRLPIPIVQPDYNRLQLEDIAGGMVLADNGWDVKGNSRREKWKAKGMAVAYTLKDNEYKEVWKEHVGDSKDFVKEKETEHKYIEKIDEGGHRSVLKMKNRNDKIVIKGKDDGKKVVTRVER